jgi:hypothetical protein
MGRLQKYDAPRDIVVTIKANPAQKTPEQTFKVLSDSAPSPATAGVNGVRPHKYRAQLQTAIAEIADEKEKRGEPAPPIPTNDELLQTIETVLINRGIARIYDELGIKSAPPVLDCAEKPLNWDNADARKSITVQIDGEPFAPALKEKTEKERVEKVAVTAEELAAALF